MDGAAEQRLSKSETVERLTGIRRLISTGEESERLAGYGRIYDLAAPHSGKKGER